MASSKEIKTPDFGGATDVTVIELLVKPGDSVSKDTPIITLESDKATMELPAMEAGIIKEIKVKIGDKVATDSVLMTIEAKGEAGASIETSSKESSKDRVSTKKAEEKTTAKKPENEKLEKAESKSEEEHERKIAAEEQPALSDDLQSDNDVHAGPGVRRLARELGVSLSQINGTGPKQRILKEDVQTYVKQRLAQIPAVTNFSTMPAIDFSKFGPVKMQALSRIKKIAGKNLQRNWMMIPHVTQFGEADITELESFRTEQKKLLEKENIKLTPLVFIMKAAVTSLKAFPHFNASLDGSSENLVMKKYFHIGVAVDTVDGLVVPVIRDVNKKGMRELAQELAEISEKARKKQLLPSDMQGSCFSISSLGGIGGTAFTPIINYPEVAILGVSKSVYRPVYQNGSFVPRLMLPLSLSYDHRVVDGADGARFIVYFSKMLSDIRNLLL